MSAFPGPDKIIEIATKVWSERGYQQTSLKDLARALGVSLSELHRHYPSRQDLALELYETINKRVESRVNSVGLQGNLGQRLREFMHLKLEILRPYKSCLVGLLSEAVDPHSRLNPLSQGSAVVLDLSLSIFRTMVTESQYSKGQDVERLARCLWAAHMVVLGLWVQDQSQDTQLTQRLVERFSNLPVALKMGRLLPGLNDFMDTVVGFVDQRVVPRVEVERTEEIEDFCDVAVIGAGPVGLLYACWLKLARPETDVVVLEKQSEVGYKVGESTLSGFCKALRSIGISHEAQQRLFFPKNGLGFFHANTHERDVCRLPEYILETFDETFQVERRVLDSLMMQRARDLGVRVFQGAEVRLNESDFSAGETRLHFRVGRCQRTLGCKLVADASGPAALLARHHGLYTRAGLPFQTGAVWAAFQNVPSLDANRQWERRAQFPRDEYTQHFCFREGWMWYIPLVSWSNSSSANLHQMYGELLSRDGGAELLQSREELSRRYGCPSERLVSLGFVLRDDRDQTLTDDPVSAFEYYARKYPSLASVLEQARPVADYVGEGRTFSSRLRVRGWSRRVTGQGWIALGDAAFFVDPLISPGMTAGAATAYYASVETLKCLESGRWESDEFEAYEQYAHRLHQAHERDSQLVSMSFNHPDSLSLVQQFQEIDARRHFDANIDSQYGLADTDVWGILNPDYQEKQKALWTLMRDHEQSVDSRTPARDQTDADYQTMVEEMERFLRPYLEANRELTPYLTQNERVGSC